MTIAISLIAGVFGLLVGSFLNVVVYRVPIGKSIVSPPSSCPGCGSAIAAYDNVPVVSWLVLGGKCRNCKQPISRRYPLVELGTGLFFAVVALALSSTLIDADTARGSVASVLVFAAFLYLAAITVALALIDIDVHKLPNAIVLPSYIVAAVLFTTASILTGDFSAMLRAGIAMGAFFVAYFLMALVYPGGMGLGDVKLAGVLGIYLGWVGWGAVAVGALAAFVLAGIYAAILLLARRANRKSGIPFGPWMLAGAWLGIGVGNAAFADYLSLFGLTAG
ncbi:prepilin peptidase [Glaciihabitans sp. UYNi722]|uniref:prepilin peptidase n=1 Tax=Glaciihabitans sp. UYNi722 TaxID=3156344 RepID=UPI00339AB2E1